MGAPGSQPSELSRAELVIDLLLEQSHLAPPHALPGLVNDYAVGVGCRDAVCYLIDLQQQVLVPFLGPSGPQHAGHVEPLPVDSTLAGRAFQHTEVHAQGLPDGGELMWFPILDGAERLGVLAVTVPQGCDTTPSGALAARLRRLASIAAELIMTKTMYGDTIVRLRRRAEMGVAAEIQWSVLPPLTFASPAVTIATALEPAYEIAGDTVDYAVDAGRAHAAILDGMGHGLQAAQLAVLAVAAYRNSRRSGQTLAEMADFVDDAVRAGFDGEAFATGVLAELDTNSGLFTWVNAGHPAPLLLRGGKLVKTLELEPQLPFGMSLGIDRESIVGAEQLELDDRILLYTDGAIEARAPGGEFFGVERLVDLTLRHLASGLPAPEAMRRLVHAMLEHQQGQLDDDATLLVLEWRSPDAQRLVV